MSKKRKTRKQKEKSIVRNVYQPEPIAPQSPSYSVSNLEILKKPILKKPSNFSDESVKSADIIYLRRDMVSITAASGIILAFDLLLAISLGTGFLHLNFLGY